MTTEKMINLIDQLTGEFLQCARTEELSQEDDAFIREAWETLSDLRETLLEV